MERKGGLKESGQKGRRRYGRRAKCCRENLKGVGQNVGPKALRARREWRRGRLQGAGTAYGNNRKNRVTLHLGVLELRLRMGAPNTGGLKERTSGIEKGGDSEKKNYMEGGDAET